MQDAMRDLDQLRLQAQRALLESGELLVPVGPSKAARKEKERLYKQITRRTAMR